MRKKKQSSKRSKAGVTRRGFIKAVGAGSATLLAAPFIAPSSWAKSPPSDTVRHAIIGIGGMGRNHCSRFSHVKGCNVVALCDVDPSQLDGGSKMLSNSSGVKTYADFRHVLDDRSIDSVTISTPDHWHTPIALSALMAGKHVYLEKPCSHNIRETNLLVKAARNFKKCVQHGTQRRSKDDHIEGIRQLRDGVIGKVYMIKAIDHQHRKPIGRAVEQSPPKGVDYDRWLGPAPKTPFTTNRWHYNWRWFWDYGNGDAANDGVHQIDVAVWGLGDRYPNRVVASGGQFYYEDDHQTPDTQTVIFEYADAQIIWEMRLWTDYKLEGHDNGNVAYGTQGKMEFGRDGVFVIKGDERIKVDAPQPDVNPHPTVAIPAIIPNFINAVREDNPGKLTSPIERGAIATNMALLANIATRLGAPSLQYDPVAETISCPGFDKEATALLGREYRKGYGLPYKG